MALRTFYLHKKLIWDIVIIIIVAQLLYIVSVFLHVDLGFKFSGAYLLVVPFYLLFVFFIFPFMVATMMEKDNRFSSPVQYEVDDGQIIYKTQFAETKLEWGSFQKVIESKYFFILVYSTNKKIFQFIPKHAFATTDDEQAFSNYLNIKIPKKEISQFDVKTPSVTVMILVMIGFCLFLCALATSSYLHNR